MRRLFKGEAVDEAATGATIRKVLQETGELIDPHTAVAMTAAGRLGRKSGATSAPVVVLSTAHPAKFPEAVSKVTGVTPQLPRGVAGLSDKPERFDRLPAEAETIKAYVRAFAEG